MDSPDNPLVDRRSGVWLATAAILIFVASACLLAAALMARLSRGSHSTVLLPAVLVALCVALGLHAWFLMLARRQQRETSSALDASEQSYKSVFDSTLDGILILDENGNCVDANPSSYAVLGARPGELTGYAVSRFFTEEDEFGPRWARRRERAHRQRETSVVRADGRVAYLEYTVNKNFLPGRHVVVVRDITRRKLAEDALRESEARFQQMASNIEEIFWMLDAENMQVLYVNSAYETITGRSCQSLSDDPTSYQDVIHPEDRIRVLSRLEESVQIGRFDEEFRIVRQDHATHWVWVRGFPVRDSAGIVRRLVGTVQDTTLRKLAEEQMARNLDDAEAARAEAEAFRKTSLALTQDLSMDYVLDTLLQSLLNLVPCESAQVILIEADTRLFLAREVQNREPGRRLLPSLATLDARESRFLMEVLTERKSLLVPDTGHEEEWASFKGFSHLRSWLCVPLVASQQVLGILSLGDTHGQTFTHEHLRLAKSLAIPAAVAIQNARLYEQAEIFRAELEQRLADLQHAKEASGNFRDTKHPS